MKTSMIHTDRIKFKIMSLIHETLYALFRDPYKVLSGAGLEPGQRVLEVGCGPGFFTIPAAKVVGQKGSVLALDVNPLAVKHVQEKIQAEGVTNAKIMVANAANTSLADQSLDLVFVFGFVRPIGGMEAIWPEIYRLLKPAGTLSVEGRLKPPAVLFQLLKRQARISRFRKVG